MCKLNSSGSLPKTRSWRTGPVSVCLLLLLLAGCSSDPMIRVVTVLPPAELIKPCTAPGFIGETNGELLDHALLLRHELNACDADKAALREWAESESVNDAN